ncbi:MAG: class I SAM-dependent methyltransferase [Methanoregula sp.]|nr:class I SAM-dependent methyltransferase [Methanoregula sp.]
MVVNSAAWEEDYARRGILWGGGTHYLPELSRGSRVLELGCGNGKTLSAMIHRGWDITAIDFSFKAVTLSRKAYQDASTCEVIVADARKSPVKNNAFDAVFAIHVIGHMYESDRRTIAEEVKKTLRTGGILFFSDFSTEDFRYGKGYQTEAATFRRGTGIITHYFSRDDVIDLFSNLNPVSIRIHQWPMRVLGKNLVRSEIKGVFVK